MTDQPHPSRRGPAVPARLTIVAALAATSLTRGSCRNAEEPEEPSPICLARADFGDPAQSPYVLPYPVGAAYQVAQGYCGSGPWSSHNQRFELFSRWPYDFPGDNVPVTFRNAGGPLDERGGPRYGVTYTALPW